MPTLAFNTRLYKLSITAWEMTSTLNDLKQHTFTISVCLWVRGLGLAWRVLWFKVSHQVAFKARAVATSRLHQGIHF